MECCFYKNTLPKNNTTERRAGEEDYEEEGSGPTDDFDAVITTVDRNLDAVVTTVNRNQVDQVVPTGECRLQSKWIFIFGGLLLLVVLCILVCCCCCCFCRSSRK